MLKTIDIVREVYTNPTCSSIAIPAGGLEDTVYQLSTGTARVHVHMLPVPVAGT